MCKIYLFKKIWIKFKCRLLKDINLKIDNLENLSKDINLKIDSLKNIIDVQHNDLKHSLDVNIIHNQIQFFELYKKRGESTINAKKRFFKSLETIDKSIKLKQDGNYILLRNFVEICNKNNLTYWITYGTLLGAVRHEGFIPWDDDIDVAMPINQLGKLKKILETNTRFCIEYICAPSSSIFLPRFLFKNHSSTWMIDIYPRVPVKGDLKEAEAMYISTRNDLLINLKNENKNLIFEGLRYEREIKKDSLKIYMEFLHKKKIEFYNKLNSRVIFGKINGFTYDVGHPINDGGQDNYVRYEDIFPLKQLKFSNLVVNCPNNYNKLLFSHYGDIYKLPNDVMSRLHGNCSGIDINAELDYLKKFSE